MKKWLALLLALVLLPTCSLASEWADEATAQGIDQFGNECLILPETDSTLSHWVETDSLPVTLPYGKKEYTVLSADLYQASSKRGDHYVLHISLDAKQLTKKDKKQFLSSFTDLFFTSFSGHFSDLRVNGSYNSLTSETENFTFAFESSNEIINIITWYETFTQFNAAFMAGEPSIEVSFGLSQEHNPNATIIINSSKKHSVIYSCLAYTSHISGIRDFSEMDSSVYEELKKSLAERGLELE